MRLGSGHVGGIWRKLKDESIGWVQLIFIVYECDILKSKEKLQFHEQDQQV